MAETAEPVTGQGAASRAGGPAPATAAAPAGELISPYGGRLIDRRLRGPALAESLAMARRAPRRWLLDEVHASDLELIGCGAFSPLTGFMGLADYRAVVEEMHLANGLPWTIPVTLPVPEEVARALPDGAWLTLQAPDGRMAGRLQVVERFRRDRAREAIAVYGTSDARHPGVRRLLDEDDWCVAGPVELLQGAPPRFPGRELEPAATRALLRERGWRRVVAFQTRNPVHRAHEYLQKCALETVDGLFLHPLVGQTKEDDLPAELRLRSYELLLTLYYPPERCLLAVYPAAMRYAGPREAVFHAIARRNYGCTHIVIGRDHAGVGGYYGPYDAQRIFDRFDPRQLGIQPLCFEHAFYCCSCAGMATVKTCPHGPEAHITLSGSRVREMLRAGELPPPQFTRPEIAQLLCDGYRRQPRAAGAMRA